MGWIMSVLFTTLFSYLGWWLGALANDGLRVFLALNGLIVGWLVAKRFMVWLEE